MSDEMPPAFAEAEDELRSRFEGMRIVLRKADGTEVDVTEAVIVAYDVAVNSMDLGSGFLETWEVHELRILGDEMGAEPFRYPRDRCDRCGHERQDHYGDKCMRMLADCRCEGWQFAEGGEGEDDTARGAC